MGMSSCILCPKHERIIVQGVQINPRKSVKDFKMPAGKTMSWAEYLQEQNRLCQSIQR